MIHSEQIAQIVVAALGKETWPTPFKKSTGKPDVLADAIRSVGFSDDDLRSEMKRARMTLGSLLIGQAAEQAFEDIYAAEMKTAEVELADDRESRTDADYIVLNGSKRPLYRINIKLHGSIFRGAEQFVGLKPEDCFPLATYKIALALEKQNRDHMPFLFVVVTVPGLQAESIGKAIPDDYVLALIAARRVFKAQKRKFEEVLLRLVTGNVPDVLQDVNGQLANGSWYIFSARRAHNIMKELLFERVFALRQRNFNRAFRNAEIDMHLSFDRDMMTVQKFLQETREKSLSVMASQIERGTI